MTWTYIAIFAVGYIARHLIGIAFRRIFKKRLPDLFGGAEYVIDKSTISEIVVSFDAGRSWFVRTPTGWAKVNHDFVKKALDKNATDNPQAHHTPGHPTVS